METPPVVHIIAFNAIDAKESAREHGFPNYRYVSNPRHFIGTRGEKVIVTSAARRRPSAAELITAAKIADADITWLEEVARDRPR